MGDESTDAGKSSDATIIAAVRLEEQRQHTQDRQENLANSQAEHRGGTLGRQLGNALGGGTLGTLSSIGGSLLGGLGGRKHHKDADDDRDTNVRGVTLNDGNPGQIVLNNSTTDPVALVVTPGQVSVALGPNHNTIVTSANGALTVGNVSARSGHNVDNPGLAKALEGAGRNAVLHNVTADDFNMLTSEAQAVISLPPAATPPAATPKTPAHARRGG